MDDQEKILNTMAADTKRQLTELGVMYGIGIPKIDHITRTGVNTLCILSDEQAEDGATD